MIEKIMKENINEYMIETKKEQTDRLKERKN